jgi:molybdopterin synthase catalytic subunit
VKEKQIEIQLLTSYLSQEECKSFIGSVQAGAEVYFVGTVRNMTRGKEVIRLEFEAYAPMAIKEMKKIAKHAIENWPLLKVAFYHRTGSLEISEIPVIIGVSAAHRKAAFEACQYCIDTLKETVPIWKKEIFSDGEEWVSAHP